MCFHKWNKWSKPKYQDITRTSTSYGGSTSKEDMKVCVQDRTCKKCEKYQWRKVDEYGL